MSEQPRVPNGVPTGGQFSVGQKPEAGIELRPLDGSYLYPPVFTSAEDVIDFWTRVEIPDEALARAEHVYQDTFASVSDGWPEAIWTLFGKADWNDFNPQPDPADVAATAEWEGRSRAAQTDLEDLVRAAVASRPAALDRRDVRPIVRSVAMIRSAVTDLSAPDYHTVCEHQVVLTSGPTSTRRAATDSGMLGFSGRFLDADNYDLDRPKTVESEPEVPVPAPITKEDVRQIVEESVNRAINQQTALLDGAFDELTDNIGQVGTAIIDQNDPRFGKRRR